MKIFTSLLLVAAAAMASVNAYSEGFDLLDRTSQLNFYHPAVPTLSEAQTALPAACEVDQVFAAVRHMTRYPSRGSYNGCVSTSNRIRDTIAAGNPPLAPELQFLKNWSFHDVVSNNVTMPENITALGIEEAKSFGKSMVDKYPKLFNEQNTVWSGSVERVQLTAKAFMDGYFGPKAAASGYKNLVTSDSKDITLGGNTLTPIDTCPAFVKDGLADAPTKAFKASVADKVVARMESLWPGYGFALDDVLGMMDICMYERNILGKDQLRFCTIFTDEEWEVYAYNKDIGYYYGSGQGHPLARTVGYPLISAIANIMSQPTTASCQSVFVGFSHDTQINAFIATLGLAEDKEFSSSPSRIFHSSRLTPMGARLITERLKCGDKRYVRVSVNEAAHVIPDCASGPGMSCPLEEYTAKIKALEATVGDFATTCKVTSGASSKFELFDKPLHSLCKASVCADASAPGFDEQLRSMKTAVVVTGASRGFGRCLALDFCREITHSDVDMHLWARNEADLEETERLVQAAWSDSPGHDVRALRTIVATVDLGSYSDYAPKLEKLLTQLRAVAYDRIYLVHNAGSLGGLCYTQEWSSHEMLSQYWEFNVTSLLWLNKRLLDVYGATREQLTTGAEVTASGAVLTLLNITSLCGIEPFSTQGLYCTGKAAREMHLRVVAKEQPVSKVRVLNYSPGPMDTDMQKTLRESATMDKKMGKMFASLHAEGRLVQPADSSKLGVKLTLSDAFENGAHVDYYDLAPPAKMDD